MPANLLIQSQFAARPSRRHHQPTATHRPPCTREYPPPQSLVNSRDLSSNTHTSAPAPASPLPSRKSPKIMQILLQTIPPTFVKLSSSLVKRSCERPCANIAPPIPKIPPNHANPASDNPPNVRQTLVITRQTLTRAPLRQRRPSHPENPQKIMQILLQTIPQSLVNSRHHSSNAHTSAPVPTSPLPSRKSPKIMQIQLQIIPPISRKLSSSLVKRSCGRTCANVAPPIPEIPQNPANPASDSPPNARQTLMISRQTLIQAPLRQRRPSHPENPQKILQILLQTTRPPQITAHPQNSSTLHE